MGCAVALGGSQLRGMVDCCVPIPEEIVNTSIRCRPEPRQFQQRADPPGKKKRSQRKSQLLFMSILYLNSSVQRLPRLCHNLKKIGPDIRKSKSENPILKFENFNFKISNSHWQNSFSWTLQCTPAPGPPPWWGKCARTAGTPEHAGLHPSPSSSSSPPSLPIGI